MDNDGNVWVCGINDSNAIHLPTRLDDENLRNIKAISAGYTKSSFIDEEGSVWECWRNSEEKSFKKVSNVSGVTCLSRGLNHAHVLDEDGFVWSVGDNDCGQLGLGDNNPRASFDKITTLPVLAKRLKKTKSANKH